MTNRAEPRSLSAPSAAARLARALLAVAALAAPAAACPYCALSLSSDTLIYIAAFLVIPYVLVTGTWLWIRSILASERAELGHVPEPGTVPAAGTLHAGPARAS